MSASRSLTRTPGWALRVGPGVVLCAETQLEVNGNHAPSRGERWRLADLDHAQHAGVERSRGGFLAARHRQLCVVQALEHIDILVLSTPCATPSRNRGDE